MGLCKCRTVTPLFCFEHRKNVCERCVLADHPTCIVRTYLRWLQDSEFDPNCSLCHEPLTDGRPLIRLSCFDLFHWDCLERDLEAEEGSRGSDEALPLASATVAGPDLDRAKCPLCRTSVIPPTNDSPLLERMRTLLASTKWAAHLPPPPRTHKTGASPERSPPITNGAQPNSDDDAGGPEGRVDRPSPSMITIEMGVRPSFSLPAQRQPDEPKVHAPPSRMVPGTGRRPTAALLGPTGGSSGRRGGSLRGSLGILLNCLTLRNLRLCSFGVSPRQSLLFLLFVVLLVLVSVHWVLPLFSLSPPTLA